MQFARKFGVILVLAAMALFIVSQFGSCNRESAPTRNKDGNSGSGTSKSQPYEPKFREDGSVWITKAETGDTLVALPLEITRSEEERQYGMMYRRSFKPDFYGMLFPMGEERLQSFWMRNTYMGLDILYINNKREIVSMVNNAKPLSDAPLRSEAPASYVLELPAGYSLSHGVAVGDKVSWYDNSTN
ncbi:DUF192 domain-containing protein [Phaeocystidibacter marisrubri]|uniref:DUF192 domain-containing protein n=1 Tax=Phaeocystidibacter marisrubri TaxID=1577780 RepID=A0A6L3ZCY4_9FLAO|nr:DUF192 domain-containing protein [Phaeocystidibacter marisrubri]KAB2815721.1 DUF192 domain-containing protein [Phaeocystidibacter marisrubri]GGH65368.1 hypothetical protein GCM10011318_02300 [Phaeocystidibacter marisrubri]